MVGGGGFTSWFLQGQRAVALPNMPHLLVKAELDSHSDG